MRKLSLLTLMAVAIVVFNAASAFALSLPGTSLDAAEKEDFFQFFHLKKRAIDERDDLATHYFRPPSRDDVVVCVDTTKSGTILQMSLIVGRDFIDNPRTNIFARDLVKSFIEAATPATSARETSDVVSEIFLRGSGPVNLETDTAGNHSESKDPEPNKMTIKNVDAKSIIYNGEKQALDSNHRLSKIGDGDIKKGDVVILSSGSLPKIPEKVSDTFKAFEGKLENSDVPITGARLIMKNHEVPRGRFLEVRIDLNSVKKEPKLEVVVEEAPDKDDSENSNVIQKTNE